MTSPKNPAPSTENGLGKTSTPPLFSVQAYQGITTLSRAAEIWRTLLFLGSRTWSNAGVVMVWRVLGWYVGELKKNRWVLGFYIIREQQQEVHPTLFKIISFHLQKEHTNFHNTNSISQQNQVNTIHSFFKKLPVF